MTLKAVRECLSDRFFWLLFSGCFFWLLFLAAFGMGYWLSQQVMHPTMAIADPKSCCSFNRHD